MEFYRRMRAACLIDCTDQQMRNGFKNFLDKYTEVKQRLNASGFGVDPEVDATLDYGKLYINLTISCINLLPEFEFSTGWVTRQCPYFHVLDEVLGTRPNVTPPCVVSTKAVGVIGEPSNIDLGPVFEQAEVDLEISSETTGSQAIGIEVQTSPAQEPATPDTGDSSESHGKFEDLIKRSFARIGVKRKETNKSQGQGSHKSGIGAFTQLLREKSEDLEMVEEKKLKLEADKFTFHMQMEEKKMEIEMKKVRIYLTNYDPDDILP